MPNFIQNTLHYKKVFAAWQSKYDAEAPKVGELAPDFELSDARGENSLRLSSLRGDKPVALVFGSFT